MAKLGLPFLKLKNSVSGQLLKSIFGIYIIFASFVTLVQLGLEFDYEEKRIREELNSLETTFQLGLSQAMWNMDQHGLDSLIEGMSKNTFVIGIHVFDDEGKTYSFKGSVPENIKKKGFQLKFIPHTFNLKFDDDTVGKVILYSSKEKIFDQIGYGFFLIIINSIIKTFFLWVIMLFFLRKILAKPVNEFTSKINELDFEKLNPIEITFPKRNEISVLHESFNSLIKKLDFSKIQLKSKNEELEIYKNQLEDLVEERTEELKCAQAELLENAHKSGMAQIAIGILHNVGNSINGVSVLCEYLIEDNEKSKVKSLGKLRGLIGENLDDLPHFLFETDKGKRVPGYFIKLSGKIEEEREANLEKLTKIQKGIETIKSIVRTQQEYATYKSLEEDVNLSEVVKDVVLMMEEELNSEGIKLTTKLKNVPKSKLQKIKIIQILTNLISNSKNALLKEERRERMIIIKSTSNGQQIEVTITDNGSGITEENLSKIFNYGFTTEKTGHGFGLHTCANYMTEMEGKIFAESLGQGKGSTFRLVFPIK